MDPLWILAAGICIVVGGILWLRLHPFLALLAGALTVALLTPDATLVEHALEQGLSPAAAQSFADQSIATRAAKKFGDTAGSIGILIAMAAIIGKCLLDSGAADRIVRSTLHAFGDRRAPLAFLLSGFVLAIPVYFDTVFYLLIPLGKAMGLRHPKQYAFYVLTIIAGGTMAHSLIPPTPGPLFVAAELNVNLGLMILGGLLLGTVTSTAGYLYARWAGRRWPIPVREGPEISLADLAAQADRSTEQLPPLSLSLLPIALPVLLITLRAVIPDQSLPTAGPAQWLLALGDKNLALILAAAIALLLLVRYQRDPAKLVATAVQSALASGGLIILITSAGGAFGGMLQQTQIGDRLGQLAHGAQFALLPMAFALTVLIRTAQGSATVAMITTVGILSDLVTGTVLPFHPLYLALAIGCGSKPFPWMNDSGFWIISRMSGFTEAETLKTFSVLLSVMALTGLAVIMIVAYLIPMAP